MGETWGHLFSRTMMMMRIRVPETVAESKPQFGDERERGGRGGREEETNAPRVGAVRVRCVL